MLPHVPGLLAKKTGYNQVDVAPSLQSLLGLALDMTCPCADIGLASKTGT